MLVFCPTCTPSTYRVAVLPDLVTATCFHTPVGNTGEPLMRCSAPEPPVVMAKRTFEPLLGTRNMFTVVPVPMSKIRRQAPVVSSRTQVAMVKFVSPLTIPPGRLTCWLADPPAPPARFTACPTRPATNVGPLTSVPLRPAPLASFALPSNG